MLQVNDQILAKLSEEERVDEKVVLEVQPSRFQGHLRPGGSARTSSGAASATTARVARSRTPS